MIGLAELDRARLVNNLLTGSEVAAVYSSGFNKVIFKTNSL